jgi:hypothetical protein
MTETVVQEESITALKDRSLRSLDSFSLGMLRIVCPALRCPLALR